jgi:hypothetical protein
MITESAAALILAEGIESQMAELKTANLGREETERLTDRAWLLALGTFHRKVCVGKLDLKGELEILGEELARIKAAGEPLEGLHAFLAKHGIQVPVLAVRPQIDRISKQILDYLAGSNEPRTRVEIEARVEGRTAHKRTALKNLCTTGKVVKGGAGFRGDPLHYSLATEGDGNNNPK